MQTSTQPPLVNQYLQPRAPGEMDLIAEARKALIEAGLENCIVAFDTDANIIQARDMNLNVQRFKLNTWIDTQLLSTRVDVSSYRVYVDTGMGSNWLKMFNQIHIPAFKLLGLPKIYG